MTDNTDLVTALQELQSRAILVLEQHLHSEDKLTLFTLGQGSYWPICKTYNTYISYTRRPLDFIEVSYFTQVTTLLQSWWICNVLFAWLRTFCAHSAAHQQWAHSEYHTSWAKIFVWRLRDSLFNWQWNCKVAHADYRAFALQDKFWLRLID